MGWKRKQSEKPQTKKPGGPVSLLSLMSLRQCKGLPGSQC